MKYKVVRLAVIFDQVLSAGGGYQQALNISISMYKFKERKSYSLKFFTIYSENIPILSGYGIDVELIKISKFNRAWLKVRSLIYSDHILKNIQIKH